MVVISFLVLMFPVGFVAYWVGRGVKLNRENREIAEAASAIDVSGLRPNDVVNVRTGEVLSPRDRETALAAGKVRFEL